VGVQISAPSHLPFTIYHLPFTDQNDHRSLLKQMNSQPSALSTQPTPTKGWIIAQYTHYRGKRLGPYYVRCWKVNGKTHKEYIKPADLERVRAACEANRERRRRGIKIAADFYNTAGNLKWLVRMTRRSEKGALRNEDYEHIVRIEANGYSTPGRTKLRMKRSFMYPHLNNDSSGPSHLPFTTYHLPISTLNALRKETKRAFAAQFATETIEEKWERWRKDHAKRPDPRPLPKARVDLSVPLDHIDALTEKVCQRLDESLAAGKSAPDWKKLIPAKPITPPPPTAPPDLPPRNFPWEVKVVDGRVVRADEATETPSAPISFCHPEQRACPEGRRVPESRDLTGNTSCFYSDPPPHQPQAPRHQQSTDRAFSDELRRIKGEQ
jgi:hypothetical protein